MSSGPKTTTTEGPQNVTGGKPEKKPKPAPSKPTLPAPASIPAILIAGAPLSGGGVLARVLTLLGGEAPATLLPAPEGEGVAAWESKPLGDVNASLLAAAKSDWSNWQGVDLTVIPGGERATLREAAKAALQSEFSGKVPRIFKDPRNSLVLPFWLDMLRETHASPSLITMVRNPLEVSSSLSARFGLEPAHATLLWLRYTLDVEYQGRGLPRLFVAYDDLLQSHRPLVDRIEAGLGIALPDRSERALVEVANHLSGALRHHRDTNEIFRAPPYASEWVADVYRIMRSWVLHGENITERTTLDTIRSQLSDAGPAFSQIIKDNSALSRKAGSTAGKLAKAEAGRASERKKLDETIADLQQKLAAREAAGDAGKLTKDVAERDAALAKLKQELGEARERLTALEASLEERQTKISSFRRELQKRETALAERDTTLADRDGKLGKANARTKSLEAELAQAAADAGALAKARDTLLEQKKASEAKLATAQQALADASSQLAQRDSDNQRLQLVSEQLEKAQAEREALLKATMDARDGADARLGQLTEQFAGQMAAQQALVMEKAALEVELVRAGAALDKAKHDIAWIDGEKQGFRQDVSDRDTRIGALQGELAALQGQKGAGDQRITELASELEQVRRAVEDKHAAFVAASTERDGLSAALTQEKGQVDEQRRVASDAQQEIVALKEALEGLRGQVVERDGRLTERDADLAKAQGERDGLAQERDALHAARDAAEAGLKDLQASFAASEDALAQAQAALVEKEQSAATLARDSKTQSEQLAMQAAQLVASKAKQAKLQQDRETTDEQLKIVRDELEQLREEFSVKEDEADNLGQYVESQAQALEQKQGELDALRLQADAELQQARGEAQAIKIGKAAVDTALQQARDEVQLLGTSKAALDAALQQARAKADDLEKAAKARQDELVLLQRDIEARDKALAAERAKLADVESQFAQTQSALRQRQLETEETAEELRFVRTQIKEEQDARANVEEQLRLTDERMQKVQAELLTQKDNFAKAEIDHEAALQARFREIALLAAQAQDVAHLRVTRHELARRLDALYLLFAKVLNALVSQAVSPLLPRKINLRRQQAVLEKYGLFEPGWYHDNNPDVFDAGMDPVAHFVAYGLNEGRAPNKNVDELRRSAAAFADDKHR